MWPIDTVLILSIAGPSTMWSGSEGSNKSNNNNNNTSLNTSPFRPFCAGNEGRLILPWNLFAGCVYILLPGIVLSIPCYQQGEKEATGVSVQTGDSETRVSPFPLLNHILGGWRAMRRGMGQRDYFYWDSSSGLIKRLGIFFIFIAGASHHIIVIFWIWVLPFLCEATVAS